MAQSSVGDLSNPGHHPNTGGSWGLSSTFQGGDAGCGEGTCYPLRSWGMGTARVTHSVEALDMEQSILAQESQGVPLEGDNVGGQSLRIQVTVCEEDGYRESPVYDEVEGFGDLKKVGIVLVGISGDCVLVEANEAYQFLCSTLISLVQIDLLLFPQNKTSHIMKLIQIYSTKFNKIAKAK